jgi:hypothetical protein
MYYFKYGARWMSCPKVKIYLLSNNYCLVFYNIKIFFVGGFPVTFLVPPKVSTTKYSIRFKYVVTRFLVNCYGLTYMGGFFFMYLLNDNFKGLVELFLFIPIHCGLSLLRLLSLKVIVYDTSLLVIAKTMLTSSFLGYPMEAFWVACMCGQSYILWFTKSKMKHQ